MKKEFLSEDRLFGKLLNETDIYQVPPMDENGNVHMFSAELLKAIYDIMKPLLSLEELLEFNDMSPEDLEQYLTGFGANIQEWQKAKEAANAPDLDLGESGMPPMTPPNDGLDHWAPAKKKKSKSQQQLNQRTNPIYSDILDELDQADLETLLAQLNAQLSNSNNSDESNNALDIANNALDIASSALQMADAALAAADAALNAADLADKNALESGDYKDIKNADKSLMSADTAQDFANQALEAAERAKQLAKDAQLAADDGDDIEAERKAKEAYDAAKEAYNKATAAKVNAKDALNSSKLTDPSQDSQGSNPGQGQNGFGGGQNMSQSDNDEFGDEDGDNSQSMQGGGAGMGNGKRQNRQQLNNYPDENDEEDEATNPTLEKVDNRFDLNGEIIHKRPVSLDMPFDGSDFVANDEDLREKCKEMAERAGQPLDADDYISPQEYATKKFQEFKASLKKWQQHNQPGSAGNPPNYIDEVMNRLFATEIDWRDLVKDFMTDKSPGNKIDVWSKRRMGLPDTHPFHKGRYLHPYEDVEEKRSGIAQVFFLVDASGSMGVTAGDGINIFEHIMSELIQIELLVKIKRSAYATFNAGPIHRDDIFTWTDKDAKDEDDLVKQFILPIAGGGTSAVEGIKSIQEYEDIYSTDEPWTLLIVVTDGGDYYGGLKDICKDPEQVDHMLWIITAEGEDWFRNKTNELVELGVDKDHIICVDINKEWGVDQEMIKKHNR